MGHDDKGNYVNYDALLKDASTWEQQKADLQALSARVAAERMELSEFGFAAPLYEPYHKIVDRLTAFYHDGGEAAGHIAASLRQSVALYQGTDQDGAHGIGETTTHLNIPL
jgi:hypothetical protein